MSAYIVVADLKGPVAAYEPLLAALDTLGAVAGVSRTWFVYSQSSCKTVKDALSIHLHGKDALFIGTLRGDWAAACDGDVPACWLNGHLVG